MNLFWKVLQIGLACFVGYHMHESDKSIPVGIAFGVSFIVCGLALWFITGFFSWLFSWLGRGIELLDKGRKARRDSNALSAPYWYRGQFPQERERPRIGRDPS